MPDDIKETKPEFTSNNRDLIVTLWALGFRLKPLGVTREYQTLYFTFDATPELQDVVRKYHAGENIDVDLSRMWVAYMLFQNHMHDTSKDRKVVVSMMSLGHKPVAKSRDGSGTLRYRFSEIGESDIWKYLSNEPFSVNARKFWLAQRQFSADVKSA
jgi:hypothetical protein